MTEAYNAEIMRVFGFWTGVLMLKLLAMTLLTVRMRIMKKVFPNPEDAVLLKPLVTCRVATDDADVERVRRSHRNDLENILPWVIITYMYLGTGPSNFIASLLIRAFVLSRVVHTLSYVIFHNQPFRGISFAVGGFIMIYQAVAITCYYY